MLAILFYSLLGGIGIAWTYFARGEWLLKISYNREFFGYEIAIVLIALLLHTLFDLIGPKKIPAIAQFWDTMQSTIGPLHIPSILLLALLSAYGEELFFRGALQPAIGYIGATLLFALSHFPPKKSMIIWPFYALVIGALLGLLRMLGGDVYSAILLHFLVNAVSLYLLRS